MAQVTHWKQRLLPAGLLLIAATSVPVLILSEPGLPRLRKLRQERQAVQDRVSRLSAEIRRLRAEAQRVKVDPAQIERTARDELGLVRQTEVVFQFTKGD